MKRRPLQPREETGGFRTLPAPACGPARTPCTRQTLVTLNEAPTVGQEHVHTKRDDYSTAVIFPPDFHAM